MFASTPSLLSRCLHHTFNQSRNSLKELRVTWRELLRSHGLFLMEKNLTSGAKRGTGSSSANRVMDFCVCGTGPEAEEEKKKARTRQHKPMSL